MAVSHLFTEMRPRTPYFHRTVFVFVSFKWFTWSWLRFVVVWLVLIGGTDVDINC